MNRPGKVILTIDEIPPDLVVKIAAAARRQAILDCKAIVDEVLRARSFLIGDGIHERLDAMLAGESL